MRVVALLILVFAAAASGASAAESQRLEIVVHGDGARATQLPEYDAATPIAIRVQDSSGRPSDSVSVAASGPQGESAKADLTRAVDGSFSGSVMLGEPGAWKLRLITRLGRTQTETLPVTLEVATLPPSNASLTGFAVGLGTFVVFGVGGFLLLRRFVEPKIETGTERPDYET